MEANVTPGGPGGGSAARRRLDAVCRAVAMLGGAALVATMLLVVGSVIGARFGKPVLGDTEIVDLLTGVLVFCFLPYCHLHGGNVLVDFFARPLPQRAIRALDALMNAVFALVASVIAWRLMVGGVSAFDRDQRSMFLNLPEWPLYALGSAVSVLWVVVILFVAWEAVLRALGRSDTSGGETQAFG